MESGTDESVQLSYCGTRLLYVILEGKLAVMKTMDKAGCRTKRIISITEKIDHIAIKPVVGRERVTFNRFLKNTVPKIFFSSLYRLSL